MNRHPSVLTIGYEGRDLNEVVRLARDSGAVTLIDVRWRPQSRKPGLSKTTLSAALEGGRCRLRARPPSGHAPGDPRGGAQARRSVRLGGVHTVPQRADRGPRPRGLSRQFRSRPAYVLRESPTRVPQTPRRVPDSRRLGQPVTTPLAGRHSSACAGVPPRLRGGAPDQFVDSPSGAADGEQHP